MVYYKLFSLSFLYFTIKIALIFIITILLQPCVICILLKSERINCDYIKRNLYFVTMASKANRNLNKKKISTQNLPFQGVNGNICFNIVKEEEQDEKVVLELECGNKCRPKCDEKKSDFDCEDYLRKLVKSHHSTLRVAFALSPDATLAANCNGENGGSTAFGGGNNLVFDQNGFIVPSLGINSSLLWKNFYLSLLSKVANYVKGIKNIQVITTQTPQQALDLLDQGQVALIASPQPITRALLEDYAAIGVSGVSITRVLLAYEGSLMQSPPPEPIPMFCTESSLVNFLNTFLSNQDLEELTFEEAIEQLAANIEILTDIRDALIIVNTEEQEEYLNERFGIPKENIIVDPTVPQCPAQLSALLNKYADELDLNICDIVYLGYYPVDCPAAAVDTPIMIFEPGQMGTFLFGTPLTLPPQLQSNAFGWVLPQWANNLQLWLQLAYDQVINDLRNKGNKHKNYLGGFYPDGKDYFGCDSKGFCMPSINTFTGTLSTSTTGFPPVQFPVGAFGTNVSYSGCLPAPFIPLCPQFSLCQHFIPAAAVYEVFLPELQCLKKPSKVTIGGQGSPINPQQW